jgi:hypothetical protein
VGFGTPAKTPRKTAVSNRAVQNRGQFGRSPSSRCRRSSRKSFARGRGCRLKSVRRSRRWSARVGAGKRPRAPMRLSELTPSPPPTHGRPGAIRGDAPSRSRIAGDAEADRSTGTFGGVWVSR